MAVCPRPRNSLGGFRGDWRWAFIVTTVLVLGVDGGLWNGVDAAQREAPPFVQALDAYDAGNYEAAVFLLQKFGMDNLSLWDRYAYRWVDGAPEEARERRRKIAALVALEASLEMFRIDRGRIQQRPPVDWVISEPASWTLLEKGCEIVRRSSPSDFERVWLLAAAALVQGAQNSMSESTGVTLVQPVTMLYRHTSHALERFPNEPRLALAVMVMRPEVRRLPHEASIDPELFTQGFHMGSPHDGLRDPDQAARAALKEHASGLRLQQAIEGLSALVNRPAIAPEVRLRRGMLYFTRGDVDEAFTDFIAASAAADPFVAYLGHVYRGLVFDARDERDAAMDAYSAALRAVPNARSGAVALIADLMLVGREEEANAAAVQAFSTPAPLDPWRYFSTGDYRFLPGYISELRTMVRR